MDVVLEQQLPCEVLFLFQLELLRHLFVLHNL